MVKYIQHYGFWGFKRLVVSYLMTKLCYQKSRLIRLPFDIRNKRFIDLGTNLTTGVGCRFEAYPNYDKTDKCIIIGNNVEMNDYVHIVSSNSVKIGNNVLLASKIFISDTSHGNYSGDSIIQCSPNIKPNNRPLVNKTVTIEDNVWVGEFVSILPGVTIGKGSIIGTLSVVNKSIPPYCIAAGSPARVIKKYNFETKKWQKLN